MVLDKLFNVKYLPLFHHFKAIYQFPKHKFFWVKIVAKYNFIVNILIQYGYSHSNEIFSTITFVYNYQLLSINFIAHFHIAYQPLQNI
jgi:hypothetical protein